MSGDPNKWLGLLRWSMKYQDGTQPTNEAKVMTEENKKFLEQVMKECVIDEVERMTQILRILDGENPQDVFETEDDDREPVSDADLEEYKDILLDELLTRADQVDNAQTFVKLKGLPVLLKLFETERAETRALAAEVFATVVQNNPPCQKAALELNSMKNLRALSEDTDESCRVRALLALSCLIRGDEKAEEDFLGSDFNGVGLLDNALTSGIVRLQRKALFLLRFLFNTSPRNAELIQQAGFPINTIVSFIGHEDVDLRESCLQTLVEYGSSDPARVKQVADDLKFKLESRIKDLEQLSDPEEVSCSKPELEAANQLLTLLN